MTTASRMVCPPLDKNLLDIITVQLIIFGMLQPFFMNVTKVFARIIPIVLLYL